MALGGSEKDDRRLLPAPLRLPAALLAGVCAVVFVALAVRYAGDRTAGRLDDRLFAVLPDAGTPGAGKRALNHVATAAPLVAVGVVVVLTIALLVARRWRDAAFAALAPGLTLLVAEVAKPLVDRTTDGFLAMPSGHTAGVTSVALTIAVLLLQRFRAHVVRAAVLGWLAATLLGTAMALVMVSLHFHYPTDTVGGYCAAVATTLAVAFGIDRMTPGREPAAP
jgi:membrane-associated phospholipid phosphatase